MRELTSHKINECNGSLKIVVLDEPGPGGANHSYRISGFDFANNPSAQAGVGHLQSTNIVFQNGPIGEVGVNGVTNEALLAIVEDRLAGFQSGQWACDENEQALRAVRLAMSVLASRTKRRVDAGVEGTHGKAPGEGVAPAAGRFRKKPVVISAEQYQAHRTLSSEFTAMAAIDTFKYTEEGSCLIHTLEGTMEAKNGDWIIRGVKGEFYPCKPDIFAATYEAVGPSPSDPGYYCDQCPHARAMHNPDGSCPCGMNCAELRARERQFTKDPASQS